MELWGEKIDRTLEYGHTQVASRRPAGTLIATRRRHQPCALWKRCYEELPL